MNTRATRRPRVGARCDNHVWARRPPLTEAVYFFDFFSLALAAFAKAFAASFSFLAACA